MVAGSEEHEAARPDHRFELGPGLLGIFPCGQGLVCFLVELPQFLFKRLGDPIERFVGFHPNVVHGDTRYVHRIASLGRQPRSVMKKDAAEDQSRQRNGSSHQLPSLSSHFSLP